MEIIRYFMGLLINAMQQSGWVTAIVTVIAIWILNKFYQVYRGFADRIKYREKLETVLKQGKEFKVNELQALPKQHNFHEITGIYIIYNIERKIYYVGQSKTVFSRLHNHFSGRGCQDVYNDYRNGYHFTIKVLGLNNSGFYNLNDFEREYIAYYDAYNKGYNRTRGNI